MNRWHWLAVGVVLGGGVLLQIPRHAHVGAAHDPAEMGEAVAPAHASTVVLDVTGMT